MFRPLLLLYSAMNTKVWNNLFILLGFHLLCLAQILPPLRAGDKEEK